MDEDRDGAIVNVVHGSRDPRLACACMSIKERSIPLEDAHIDAIAGL
jgi:hypothetical protein